VAGLAMGLGGWLIGPAPTWVRVLAASGGLVLFYPAPAADIVGAAAVAAALVWTRIRT
jgi:TRAP-type uncharacterized transport system fused permease subunit